jgi:cell division protein FtsZ
MDFYNIFEDHSEEKNQAGQEGSFMPDAKPELSMTHTPFPATQDDPLGIVGGTEALSANTPHINNKSEEAMKFDLPEHSSIIKVIGVGGGGSNAVNHMYRQGINGVDFVVCNTDKQALDISPVPHKVVLGSTLTEGRGAGSIPEVGRNAAIENIEDIRRILANNTKMVFITAGMGGGTGTGAAPIIAGIAREMGILTVGIVTIPFLFEGKKRRQQAEDGLEQLKQNVDTLLVISNDKLREMYGNLKLSDAFSHADDVLAIAAKSIAEIISLTQQINVDFADICTVMRNSGVAIMGSSVASGENRAIRAVEAALNSPLLNDNNITGARYVLLNIISGADEITMDELGEITDYIQESAGQTAEIIKGYGVEAELGDSVSVTIIATGFHQHSPVAFEYSKKIVQEKVVRKLEEPSNETAPAAKPEAKAETVNPLEPFLINKQPDPQPEARVEVKAENVSAPVAGPLEPFLVKKEEAAEPVAEASNLFTSAKVEETKAEEVAQVEAKVEPVSNPEMTFEVANSQEENIFSAEVSAMVSEEPVMEKKEEPVAEAVPQKKEELVMPVAEVKQPESSKQSEEDTKRVMAEEIQRKAQERIQRLKELSMKLKTPQGLNEMEHEPAYKRRNIQLENVPHSSESQVSRFTLTETDEKKVEIRPNNSFLHDNVD